MTNKQAYTRIEFVFNIGTQPKVLAFGDFSSQAISFGIPKSFQFTDYSIKPSSENYERITVHQDGRIKTHFPLTQNFEPPWDGYQTPLAKWTSPWTVMEELYWGNQQPSIRDVLVSPKNVSASPQTYQVPISFPCGIDSTQIRFSLLPSLEINMVKVKEFAPEIEDPGFCTWVLVDSWPYVILSMRGVVTSKQSIELKSVGRDYRVS